MLVLTRKRNESVTIGDGIEVHVVELVGDKVRLGFVAPKDVKILRPDAKRKETQQPEPTGKREPAAA